MPFTFSHPAIILPLNYLPKRWFSLTGLVVGSLTPDFEYFLKMKIESTCSHTILGIFLFNLPLGLVLTFAFHLIIKNDLFQNLPKGLKVRFICFQELNWNKYFIENWIVVILSLIMGTISHLLWDSFTHQSGFFVKIFTVLDRSVELLGKQWKVFKIVQHSSTIIGGIVIANTIFKLPKSKEKTKKIDFKYWIILGAIVVLVLTIKLTFDKQATKIGNSIVSLISSFLIGLLITPSLLKKYNSF